ncbi:MAG: hypothetical protein H0X07_00140 [Gemmatimonadales bacterium]|nr:hypothetical protein [Gemmatimonadales bacterium]
MPFGVSEGIAAAGAIGNFFSGRSAMKSQKENMRRQSQLLGMQNQTYRATQPMYLDALRAYAGNANLGGDLRQAGANRFQLGSDYGGDADRLRFQAAEEDISRLARMRGAGLQSQLARRGIAGGSQAAALAGNERSAMADLTRFRRSLAINAGQERERRLGLLMGAMGPAFGQGSQAAAGYGQQAGIYGQQANQAAAATGQIISDWTQRRALEDYMKQRQEQNWWDNDPVFGG